MTDLLHLIFDRLIFNIDKICQDQRFNQKEDVFDNNYYVYIPLTSVQDVSLLLIIYMNGKCKGDIIDDIFGQPFPDTKEVCYEVLCILNDLEENGFIL